mmetsp:Transcript_4861/g.8848  ORF Transcript_4861/g.8848 Transcript_4861/m.8848 type:complete len:304 (-) Transcript_4861:158-1069(-)|eukprot:CAMPEP_0197541058 /NCGR_PEP_ID=MMETSP1318-20131121/66949_1 /TAXON_ID=552666 /ORGANISM="Partenskyella glossopodia, Strain RCC365" /LENGTH=303 /DNA_ID=CAMNT_0043100191 /DNA_START=232 /DNA_END=1143 /DNA_ORIENTATION=+
MANQFGGQFRTDDLTLDDIEKEIHNDFDDSPQHNHNELLKVDREANAQNLSGLQGSDLKHAIAAKYGIKLKAKETEEKEKSEIGVDSGPKAEEEEVHLEDHEMRRGFKFYLYHSHSLLSVLCVHHAYDMPRYARIFLLMFDLCVSMMFALTLKTTSLNVAERLSLSVFLCLVISFTMSAIFKNVGFNKFMTGTGMANKLCTIFVLMVIPSSVVLTVIFIYMMRQDDGGKSAAILFGATTVLSWIVEVLVWYLIYDCCKAYCSCCMCCCPLDDGEVAAADLAHAKKKEQWELEDNYSKRRFQRG